MCYKSAIAQRTMNGRTIWVCQQHIKPQPKVKQGEIFK